MSSFSRLIDMASKALDKGTSSSNSSQAGGRDWRAMVRDVAGAVTGDTPQRAQTDPSAPSASPLAGTSGAAEPTSASVGLTPPSGTASPSPRAGAGVTPPAADAADRAAIARYEYLLQTSDPHQVEAIHREAFARLTPQQRAQVQAGMRAELLPAEQPRSAEAGDLARSAARTEAMRPGIMAGLLARAGRGGRPGGSGARNTALRGAGGLLGAVAGGAILSAVAAPLLAQAAGMGVDFEQIASGLELDAIAGGLDVGATGDLVSGAGDVVSGFGDQLSNFEIPGFGDLFGR